MQLGAVLSCVEHHLCGLLLGEAPLLGFELVEEVPRDAAHDGLPRAHLALAAPLGALLLELLVLGLRRRELLLEQGAVPTMMPLRFLSDAAALGVRAPRPCA